MRTSKDVSLVRTGESPSDDCNVFEGFMDFLSAVALKWTEMRTASC